MGPAKIGELRFSISTDSSHQDFNASSQNHPELLFLANLDVVDMESTFCMHAWTFYLKFYKILLYSYVALIILLKIIKNMKVYLRI